MIDTNQLRAELLRTFSLPYEEIMKILAEIDYLKAENERLKEKLQVRTREWMGPYV